MEQTQYKNGRKFKYGGKIVPEALDPYRPHTCHVKGAAKASWAIANCMAMERIIKVVIAEHKVAGTVMYWVEWEI